MDCLYTEAELSQSGSQLVVFGMTLDRTTITEYEKNIKRVWPDAWTSYNDLMELARNEETNLPPEELPRVGDVVWIKTGGSKVIGFCIVKTAPDSEINKKAVVAVTKSICNKARELGISYYGMDMLSCNNGREWAAIVEDIEKNSEGVQAVVCVPTNELLEDVLSKLPGKEFKMVNAG